MATFSLSPDALALFYRKGSQPEASAYAEIALRHILMPMPRRQFVFAREPLRDHALAAAASLIPR